jgi:hypothetical protein
MAFLEMDSHSAISSDSIRLTNEDAVDLYNRVKIGTPVRFFDQAFCGNRHWIFQRLRTLQGVAPQETVRTEHGARGRE